MLGVVIAIVAVAMAIVGVGIQLLSVKRSLDELSVAFREKSTH